jgi:hypothetical protein
LEYVRPGSVKTSGLFMFFDCTVDKWSKALYNLDIGNKTPRNLHGSLHVEVFTGDLKKPSTQAVLLSELPDILREGKCITAATARNWTRAGVCGERLHYFSVGNRLATTMWHYSDFLSRVDRAKRRRTNDVAADVPDDALATLVLSA